MSFTVKRCNQLFDEVYGHGLFMGVESATRAKLAGFDVCATWLSISLTPETLHPGQARL